MTFVRDKRLGRANLPDMLHHFKIPAELLAQTLEHLDVGTVQEHAQAYAAARLLRHAIDEASQVIGQLQVKSEISF